MSEAGFELRSRPPSTVTPLPLHTSPYTDILGSWEERQQQVDFVSTGVGSSRGRKDPSDDQLLLFTILEAFPGTENLRKFPMVTYQVSQRQDLIWGSRLSETRPLLDNYSRKQHISFGGGQMRCLAYDCLINVLHSCDVGGT